MYGRPGPDTAHGSVGMDRLLGGAALQRGEEPRPEGREPLGIDAEARVGGGGAPEHPLPSAAVSLPASFAERARAILGPLRDLCRAAGVALVEMEENE